MSEPFVGEIRMFPYTFAPLDWAYCDGKLLSIAQNQVLYAVIGTTYGGDGVSNFALPNLQGKVPMHAGQGPGLSPRVVSQSGGSYGVALTELNMPSHTHQAKAYYDYPPTTANPASCFASSDDSKNIKSYIDDDQNHVPMSVSALQTSGNNVAHENRQPYLVVPFCIALVGMYPSRP